METTALGAAYLAGYAAGLCPDLPDFAAMWRCERRFEPGMDAMTRERMNVELMRIQRETGKTVLLITHSIPEAVFLADRVVVMGTRPGRIKKEFPISFDRPRSLSLKRDPKFLAMCDDIWRLIEQEADRINVLRTGE